MAEIKNIIAIGTDNRSLIKDSDVYHRIKLYSALCERYYNFVFTSNEDHKKIIDGNYITIPVYGKNKVIQIINLYKFIKSEKILKASSIISSQDPFEIGLISYVLAKRTGIKLLIQMHTDTSTHYYKDESVRNKIQYYISQFIFRKADAIRVVSTRMKTYLKDNLKISENKIHVIPVHVDVQKFVLASNKKFENNPIKYDFIVLSRIEKVKNIDLAIDSIFSINQKSSSAQGYGMTQRNPKLTLKIVGEGNDKKRLMQKYSGKDYDFITWANWNDKVEDEYISAKILLITSDYEGFAITAIEAVASGIPVVMTPVGCAGDFIINNKNGIISKGHKVSDFEVAIEAALDNYDTLIKNIKNEVLSVNNREELISKTNELFKSTLANNDLNKNKLCYILPEASNVTHMKYNVEFLESLSEKLDIYLIIEKGDSQLESKITKVRYINKNYKSNLLYKFIRIFKTFFNIIDARLKGYKVFYIHYSFVGALIVSLIPGSKVFYWNCGIPFKYKRPFITEMYQRLAYKLIDKLVTGTYGLGLKYAEYYNFDKSKILAIPNWIDVDKYENYKDKVDTVKVKKELNIKDNDKVLFFNQRLSERKGAHYIIPILKEVSEEVIFVITNDGPYKNRLVTELENNNLMHRVRLLGKVSHDKILDILSITSIYILSSEEEGMSHSLMEAMLAKVPVVAYDVGSNKDMYPAKYQDYVIDSFDIDKFINKVNLLLNDNSLAIELGNALNVKVKEYDKVKVISLFIQKVI